jgi:VWFA-related protein
MPHKSGAFFFTLFTLVSILAAGVYSPASRLYGQSQNQERPRIKTFGESLKHKIQNRSADQTESKKDKSPDAKEEEVLRLKTTLVAVDVLVLNQQGRAVTGLKQSDFIIKEDGQAQQVSNFSLGNDTATARSIVLIIDYSGSQLPYIITSVEAAKILVEQLNPKDRMAIVTDDVSLLVDFTSDKKELKEKLESLKKQAMSGKTGLSRQFSALMATLNELFDDEDLRPIIIFQTDGDELTRLGRQSFLPPLPANSSPEVQAAYEMRLQAESLFKSFTLEDVFTQAEKSRATIYTVIPGHQLIGLSSDEQIKQMKKQHTIRFAAMRQSGQSGMPDANSLPEEVFARQAQRVVAAQSTISGIAKLTGGWFSFLEDPSQAADIYSRMLSDINLRYVIGFYPTNESRDGKRRKLTIEVRNHPEYKVLGRRSYYAPNAEK